MGPINWVIRDKLARSSRPGFPAKAVSAPDVDAWLADLKAGGIRTIICLLGPDQLEFYHDVPGGLLAHYRAKGFSVAHIPTEDHPGDPNPLSPQELAAIADAYQRAEKPALIHCSAGITRTGAAVAYICGDPSPSA